MGSHLDFKSTEEMGHKVYSGGGRGGGEVRKTESPQTAPCPLSTFYTHHQVRVNTNPDYLP